MLTLAHASVKLSLSRLSILHDSDSHVGKASLVSSGDALVTIVTPFYDSNDGLNTR